MQESSAKLSSLGGIHSTAIVDSSAEIDTSVTVGAYSIIGANVKIASGTTIGPHVVIQGPTTIGKDNRIFQFSSIGEIPQDKKNWIMAYVHIAHDCDVKNDITFANGSTLAGHVTVGDFAILGGFTLVHQFCQIGEYAFCAMGTALNRDLPPYLMASGNYATTHGLNKEGLRRNGFSEDCIQALHKSYMALVRSKQVKSENTSELNELSNHYPEVKHFVDFISTSKRGIAK